MAKKRIKKKKQKEVKTDVLAQMDQLVDKRFMDMKLEIEFYQNEINKAHKKAKKRAKKQMKRSNDFYAPHIDNRVREDIIRKMEGTNFFERIMNILQEMIPVVRVIAELVKSLIVAILSIDSVKFRIKKDTLVSMQNVYTMANSVVSTLS